MAIEQDYMHRFIPKTTWRYNDAYKRNLQYFGTYDDKGESLNL